MNRTLLVALLLALAIAALALTSFSAPSLLSEKSGACPGGENCTGNCGENCVCTPGTSCKDNNSQENCSQSGSCPLKPSRKTGGCSALFLV